MVAMSPSSVRRTAAKIGKEAVPCIFIFSNLSLSREGSETPTRGGGGGGDREKKGKENNQK